ncbi:hypothetical protein NWMN_1707 [Staphylococcus aureus subsp. aureus str. Newman]|uniref:Uncharacterized protein n=1 Tax=Staphylococcus aureus (strain Newman) TaxID=426430 RepID=A0A0H3KH89_STAAE|nr:hypothetical protein NWMN_1707 [Staphylococcus aureus subsp. aureus str. Newman]
MEFFSRYVISGIRFCDFALDRVVAICKYVFQVRFNFVVKIIWISFTDMLMHVFFVLIKYKMFT